MSQRLGGDIRESPSDEDVVLMVLTKEDWKISEEMEVVITKKSNVE